MECIKGKKALVTGSSQGLGKCIAEMLSKEGCEVVINCAHSADKAEAVAEGIRKAGGKASAYVCDISSENAVKKMYADLGPVDILVNNARIDPWKRTPDMTEGEWWDKVMSINLRGCFLCSVYFFEQAKPRKYGRIVNISSVRAFRAAEPSMIAYGVSKLGMHGISRAFAENGAPYNITANTVAPGMVLTENIWNRLTKEKYAEESGAIALKRGGTMEEMGDAVLFAIRNGYVTGETINVNGGMYYAP